MVTSSLKANTETIFLLNQMIIGKKWIEKKTYSKWQLYWLIKEKEFFNKRKNKKMTINKEDKQKAVYELFSTLNKFNNEIKVGNFDDDIENIKDNLYDTISFVNYRYELLKEEITITSCILNKLTTSMPYIAFVDTISNAVCSSRERVENVISKRTDLFEVYQNNLMMIKRKEMI